MTTEVAILNKNAVALAADSAATIFLGNGGHKIYNTANKLFMLSKYEPVGIMVNGGSSIMEIPWELVIKSYRQDLGKKCFDYIDDYCKDFLEYVRTFFSVKAQEDYFYNLVFGMFHKIAVAIDDEVKNNFADGQVDNNELLQITSNIITEYSDMWSSLPMLPTITDNYCENLLEHYEQVITKAKTEAFKEIPIPGELSRKLVQLSIDIITKDEFSSTSSGIAIAGYGRKELFPSLAAFVTEGVVDNILKQKIDQKFSVEKESKVKIFAFAQRDMVDGFVQGVDPSYLAATDEALRLLFLNLSKELAKVVPKLNDSERENIDKDFASKSIEMYNLYLAVTKLYREIQFSDPVYQAVQYLDKEELAAMAETFINLTSFKRRVTMTPETVGGPVDVALISKFDGFIWVKRKHYFEPSLNHHFFNNYYSHSKERDHGND